VSEVWGFGGGRVGSGGLRVVAVCTCSFFRCGGGMGYVFFVAMLGVVV
jgi:hypothetical protein